MATKLYLTPGYEISIFGHESLPLRRYLEIMFYLDTVDMNQYIYIFKQRTVLFSFQSLVETKTKAMWTRPEPSTCFLVCLKYHYPVFLVNWLQSLVIPVHLAYLITSRHSSSILGLVVKCQVSLMRGSSVRPYLLHSWCWFYKSLHTPQGGTHTQTFQIVFKGFQFPFFFFWFLLPSQ